MRIICILFLLVFAIGCSNETQDQRKMIKQIESAEEALEKDAQQNTTNDKNALKAARAYMDYVYKFPEDTVRNPEFMTKSAQLYASIAVYDSAIVIIDKLIAAYPASDYSANMLHYKAFFVYEEGMKDLKKAEETYLHFLERYPNHPLYTSVLFSLESLHKEDKEWLELIRKFEAENNLPQ